MIREPDNVALAFQVTLHRVRFPGMYRCGPAPVEAVRKGEVNVGFDSTFVYTEVRADMCVFKESEDGSWSRIKTIPN